MTHTFKREAASDILDEVAPLLMAHFKEVGHHQDIKLNPDLSAYANLEKLGLIRTYTVRQEDGELVGYAVYFVKHHIHYRDSLQAIQDVIYVRPGNRGMGGRFIKWCDEELRKDGVQVVHQHIKAAHNFGPMLERMGYELVDYLYQKRLDKPAEVASAR